MLVQISDKTRIGQQGCLWEGRVLVWFSCGAASAVAAKLAIEKYPNAEIINCDTLKDEHPDNARFMQDVSKWLGREIIQIRSNKYSSIVEVFEAKQFMSSRHGAPCTHQLKRLPRKVFQATGDLHIFGYTVEEQNRILNFEDDNPDLLTEWILRDCGLTKDDCFQILSDAGIRRSEMYDLGFNNANCEGCVKSSSPKYWNLVRLHFPTTFQSRAEQSRRLGAKLVVLKGVRIFLDELPSDAGNDEPLDDISCGPQCSTPDIGKEFE